MRRLAIIDHASHMLYIEDVSEETLNEYDGDEQAYIDNMYDFEGDYSWDWIIDADFTSEHDKDHTYDLYSHLNEISRI